jgi:hypothetical protein
VASIEISDKLSRSGSGERMNDRGRRIKKKECPRRATNTSMGRQYPTTGPTQWVLKRHINGNNPKTSNTTTHAKVGQPESVLNNNREP